MQFLYPTYLWGLLLVIIPILIHLFQLRKYRLVYFSSLKFLKQLDIEQKKRSRIKDLLLLITRILLISALVLAFAQPYLPAESNIDSNHQTIGIYIDNSMSMENEAEGESLFDHAKKSAVEIVGKFPESSRFYLLNNDDIFSSRFPIEGSELINKIEMLDPSSSSSNLSTVIERFNQILDESESMGKPVLFVLSDNQESFVKSEAIPDNPSYPVSIIKMPNGISNNIFIDSCWFSSPIQNLEKRHTLHARINNSSDQDLNRYPVHLLIEDSLVAQETVNIPAYGTEEFEFSYKLVKNGWQNGYVEIRDYPVSFDNKFHFAYKVSEKISVLQIYSELENPNLKALFESDPYFDYHHANSNSVPYQDLNNFKFVILNSVNSLSNNLSKLLIDYVDQGGSLVVLPPANGELGNLNEFTTNLQSPVFSNKLVRESEARIPDNMKSYYNQISLNPDQQVEWPRYFKYYRLVDNFAKSENILTIDSGRPVLTRNSFGKGFVTLSSVPLVDEYTNLHIHPLFIPILYYLGNTGLESQELYYRIGRLEPILTDIEPAQNKGPASLVNRNEQYEFIPGQFRDTKSGRLMLYMGDYKGPAGTLGLMRADSREAILAVNYSQEESKIENLSAEEIRSFLGQYELINISISDNETSIGSSENILIKGKSFPLVRILLILALVFLITESLIHRFKS